MASISPGVKSLKQLNDIRPDELKIDKSFVDDIGDSDASIRGCMIPQIISIARATDTKVIVEGVETSIRADVRKALGAGSAKAIFSQDPCPSGT